MSKLTEIKTMQAHPVPQNIMQVEFQLVGNLTLRQFGYLAIAGVLAWIIFISPLLSFVRIPLAIAMALFGAALAFLPVNDMRLEKWIIAFFQAIYSPTRRVWRKEVENIDFLTDKFTSLVARPALIHTTRANNRARLDLYLNTTRTQVKNNLDQFEERKLHTLDFAVEAPASLTISPNLAPEELPALTPPSEEAPRRVELQSQQADTIASKVIFTPVATIKLPDRNIFVKPLSNKRRHSLNPKTAHQGTILLPIRGERIFQVSQEIRQKLNSYVRPQPHFQAKPEVLLRVEPPPLPTPPRTGHTAINMPHLPERPPLIAVPPLPPIVTTPPKPIWTTHQPEIVPPSRPLPPPPESKEENKEAAVENPAPTPVINVFVTQPTPINPPPLPIPLQEGVVQSPVATQTLYEPTTPKEEPRPVYIPIESESTESLKQNIKQLTSEESLLRGEVERYKAQEKYLAGQLALSQREKSTDNSVKLKELEAQMKQMQQEKLQAQDRAQRLQGLITQLSTTQPKVVSAREIITPQAAQAPQPPEIHVVSPKRAEGKMAPPMTTVPNVINGVVKDVNGFLLSGTIIVVKDKNDEPVRALKTNQVGQFAISTALPNGTYLMEVEKDGYEFDYIEIKLTGELLAPIEIRSRGGQNGT